MATEMTPQERADLNEIACKLVLQINEITPVQWDKHDDKDRAIILAALQDTRRAALLEVIEETLKPEYYHAYNGVSALHEWLKDRLAQEG